MCTKIQLHYDKLCHDQQTSDLNDCFGDSVCFQCSIFKSFVVEQINSDKFHLITLNLIQCSSACLWSNKYNVRNFTSVMQSVMEAILE